MLKNDEPSTTSVEQLFMLLGQVCKNPAAYLEAKELLVALKSQGALAKFASTEHGVVACSLNTLKAKAAIQLPGGFASLDNVRKAARMSLEREKASDSAPSKSSRGGLAARVAELEAELEGLTCDLEVLTSAFQQSLVQSRSYAAGASQTMKDLCRKEQSELLALVGLKGPGRIRRAS